MGPLLVEDSPTSPERRLDLFRKKVRDETQQEKTDKHDVWHAPRKRRNHRTQSSLDAHELALEVQVRFRRDGAAAALSVPEFVRNVQRPLPAHAHRRDAFVPAGDDSARAESERKRRPPVGPRVVHLHHCALRRQLAAADAHVSVAQP
eukprot:CAMPEP_0182806120 /NCGR_PEP_ID=MMETSP0006_2-20121128/5427_1 /TAXON_ID=97485 /ORGANISM="Prymnesium parvum, Strain Texoma1" /LENGTH=147 /DNA_ID=CAMNT_0024931709 /DNA_START=317 /DNA_END=760 /DNA_ORIENTATION=+